MKRIRHHLAKAGLIVSTALPFACIAAGFFLESVWLIVLAFASIFFFTIMVRVYADS